MMLGTTQRRLATLSGVSALLTSAHNSITTFFTLQRRSTIPSCQPDRTADTMDMGDRQGNHDDSGTVRATRDWIRVG